MKHKLVALTLLVVVLFVPAFTFATIGVGVGTGKIVVEEKMKPGMIYNLPPLTVINTGTETSDYEATTSYLEGQKQLRTEKSWFIFSPQHFTLKPGKVQAVRIKLNLPVDAKPGDYFAYLIGQPVRQTKQGVTSINVAAAAKLYFTVVPANVFAGIYYKLLSFWQVYAPWPQRALWAVVIVAAVVIAKNFLNINIDLKKPAKGRSKESEK